MKEESKTSNEAGNSQENSNPLGPVKRFVSFLLRHINGTICIGYMAWWSILATLDIGTVTQPEPQPWYLPFLVIGFLLPPVYFAYQAGKEDACKKAIEQIDSFAS